MKHPISFGPQQFVLPANAENGDQLGEVQFASTFVKTWNYHEGTDLDESDFTFMKIAGPSNFSVDFLTGMITVDNLVGISADTSITVRIAIAGMHMDVSCDIVYAQTADSYFFDASYDGSNGASNGSRDRPFLKFNGSGLTPTAGKYYFWKRGETYIREWSIVINPLVDGEFPEWITYDAYGQGNRPLINGTDQRESPTLLHRFVDVGGGSFSNDDPLLEANKFRISNFSTWHDKSDNFYPFLIKARGKHIQFRRIDMEETVFTEGFMYFQVDMDLPYEQRHIYLESIRTKNSKFRSIKIETGGLVGLNFYCVNLGATVTEHPAPGAANHPYVDLQFIYAHGDNISTSNLGLQVRSSNQKYRWAWLSGFGHALVSFNHSSLEGLGGIYAIYDSGFSDIILEGVQSAASYFGRHPETFDVSDGVYFERVTVVSGKGFQVGEGAINTIFRHCVANNLTEDGFRVFSEAGNYTKIINCTALGNGSNDIELSREGVEVINSNFNTLSGNAIQTTNSNSSSSADLIGAGTYQGYAIDVRGNLVKDPPSIGAIEYDLEEVVKYNVTLSASPSGYGTVTEITTGPYAEGEDFEILATPKRGKKFLWWEIYGLYFSDNPNYVGTMGSETLPLDAVFDDDPDYNPGIIARGIRFVSLVERYGNAVYDTYTRVKTNKGVMGASLMDVKWLADRLLRHEWDMANVPFCNKEDKLYSLVGPDLICGINSGQNGSVFDKDGLLVTSLPGGPRFTYDPKNGLFEGVYLEVEDENILELSEDFSISPWSRHNSAITLNSGIDPSGNNNANLLTTTSPSFPQIANSITLSTSNTYHAQFWAKKGTGVQVQQSLLFTSQGGRGRINFIPDDNWVQYKSSFQPIAESSFYVIATNSSSSILTNYLTWGCQLSNFNTSYIKTTGSPVVRPADIYTATGLINTSDNYAILKRINGETILQYVEPVAGTMKTYKNGVYVGVEAFTPDTDLELNSLGSDFLSAVAYYSGTLDESKRIERSIM